MRFTILAAVAAAVSVDALLQGQDVFTAKDMLEAPRPGGAMASPDGKHAIEAVNEYSFKTSKSTRSVYLLTINDTSTPPALLFSAPAGEASELIWLSNSTFAYLNGTDIYAQSIKSSDSKQQARHILELPTEVESLTYEPVTGRLAFSAAVWGDGSLMEAKQNDEEWQERGTTGVVYDELFVRHWDTWRTPGRVHQLFLTDLPRADESPVETFKPSQIYWAPFNGTNKVSKMDAISTSSYSLSPTHLALSLSDPNLSQALHTRHQLYLVDLPKALPHAHDDFVPMTVTVTSGEQGAVNDVRFSPDGTRLSWLEMREDRYESDRNRVMTYTIESGEVVRWTETWDRSPSAAIWSLDSSSLYMIAERHGRALPYHLTTPSHLPTPLLFNGSTSSITPIDNSTLLLSMNSLTSPSNSFLLSTPSAAAADRHSHPSELHQITDWHKKAIGSALIGQQGEEFWFEGADGWRVMGWAVKPKGWKAGQMNKWPMAFLIHGGPQGAWEDGWSTRWNPAVFAQQGYFVIAINPTGSTGYGQEFTDRIKNEWGGRPYKDLIAGYDAALELFPEIDQERTVALGASYGGYMINWINGHPGAFNFKALVCHDGVFSTTDTFYSTEEMYFPWRENGGPPTTHRAEYEKWNPVNHVSEWSTPQLVIHSGKDFRLTESSGISAFSALQLQGVPSRFLYFPEENHWVLKPGNSLKWHAEVFRWLEEWVGERESLVIQ